MHIASQPAPTGTLSVVHIRREDRERAIEDRMKRLRQTLVRDDSGGHFAPAREGLLYDVQRLDRVPPQQRLLAWVRDNIHPGLPRAWYRLMLGHDLHIATWAELYYRHFHATEPDPFTGKMGWWENVGLASSGKVTAAFRDLESGYLVTDSTAYGDFKYHEVGTDATAESNAQTGLIVSTGIARVAGTQTNPTASTYQSVATVTADSSETWQEHGLFNASTSVTLLDRSVISPTVTVVASDTCQFTYVLTKNAEA
jgi:hypothetical protein